MGSRRIPLVYTIPPNSRCHIPSRWVFVDTETIEEKISADQVAHHLKLGQALYWRRERNRTPEVMEWLSFTQPGDLWDWINGLARSRETLHLVAHNIPFDFMVLAGFRELPLRGWSLSKVYHRGTTTIMSWRKGTRGIRVVDSMNWWPVALREIGRMVGLEKMNMPAPGCSDDDLAAYCRRDVEIIYHAVRQMADQLDDLDLGSMRYTAASVAWSVWRHKFYRKEVTTHHKPVPVALERNAYIGGLVSVRKLYAPPSVNMTLLDVHSMYPYVMQEYPYPVELQVIRVGLDADDLADELREHCLIADVDVETDIPIIPFRMCNRIFYPVGRFRTILCSGTLDFALRQGMIRKVRMVAIYGAGAPFFDYVKYWYGERMKAKAAGDSARESLCKLALNSLYGKFGQRSTEMSRVGDAPIDIFRSEECWNVRTGEMYRLLEAGGSMIRIDDGDETLTSFPAVAAHVTDYARMYLWRLANWAGLDNVYYMDTDSLMVNDTGRARLLSGEANNNIGSLGIQAEGAGCKIYAKKDYRIGSVRKCKAAKNPDAIGKSGMYTERQGLGIYAAAEIEQVEGARWLYVAKRYNPFIDGATINRKNEVRPMRLPRDLDRLLEKSYTRGRLERLS